MAVQNLIGFETGVAANEIASNGGTFSIATTNVRSGTYALRSSPATTATGFGRIAGLATTGGTGVTLGLATGFFSFYVYIVTAPAANDEVLCHVYTSTTSVTSKMEVRINSSRQLVVYDLTPTLVATGTTAIPLNTWTRIDVKSANGSPAAYEVRINSVSELSGTCNQGANSVGNICLGKDVDRNGNGVEYWFDDVWVDSTAYPTSDYKIVIDKPTANGATMSWTGGTAPSDYTQINAIPAQTTTYVKDPASTSIPVVGTFAMQTYAQMGITVGSTILAIKSFSVARDDVTITNTYQTGISSNGVDSITAAKDLSATSSDFAKLHATDPNTSAAWGQSGLEAVLFKIAEGTSAVSTRCNSAFIMVAYVPAVVTSVSSSTLSLLGVG